MHIKTKSPFEKEQTQSVAYYVERKLEGRADGRLESAAESAHNAAKALGRLVELLAERGVLDADDVVLIAGGFSTEASLEKIV